MKRILMVIPTLRMGGAEKSLISLLKALDPQRVAVDLFLFEAGGVLQAEVPDWVNILEADAVTRGMTLELRYYLRELIKKRCFKETIARVWMSIRPKISSKPYFSWGGVKRYIPALTPSYDVAVGFLEGTADFFVQDKVTAKKKIGWIHTDYTGRKPNDEEKQYYSRFDNLVTITDMCKVGFEKAYPETAGKLQVIENIVLTDDVVVKAMSSDVENWKTTVNYHLVTVGRLDHHKGIDIAAKAAKILKESGRQFCWHVYGQGSMQSDLEQYIQENSLEECFVLEGLRSNPYPYMKQADMIVQPSRVEGKSLVLDEAKILGKAIVVTDYPSVRDQITDRVTGLVVGMTPEGIARGIEMLLEDGELRQRLGANAAREPNSSYLALEKFYRLIEG